MLVGSDQPVEAGIVGKQGVMLTIESHQGGTPPLDRTTADVAIGLGDRFVGQNSLNMHGIIPFKRWWQALL